MQRHQLGKVLCICSALLLAVTGSPCLTSTRTSLTALNGVPVFIDSEEGTGALELVVYPNSLTQNSQDKPLPRFNDGSSRMLVKQGQTVGLSGVDFHGIAWVGIRLQYHNNSATPCHQETFLMVSFTPASEDEPYYLTSRPMTFVDFSTTMHETTLGVDIPPITEINEFSSFFGPRNNGGQNPMTDLLAQSKAELQGEVERMRESNDDDAKEQLEMHLRRTEQSGEEDSVAETRSAFYFPGVTDGSRVRLVFNSTDDSCTATCPAGVSSPLECSFGSLGRFRPDDVLNRECHNATCATGYVHMVHDIVDDYGRPTRAFCSYPIVNGTRRALQSALTFEPRSGPRWNYRRATCVRNFFSTSRSITSLNLNRDLLIWSDFTLRQRCTEGAYNNPFAKTWYGATFRTIHPIGVPSSTECKPVSLPSAATSAQPLLTPVSFPGSSTMLWARSHETQGLFAWIRPDGVEMQAPFTPEVQSYFNMTWGRDFVVTSDGFNTARFDIYNSSVSAPAGRTLVVQFDLMQGNYTVLGLGDIDIPFFRSFGSLTTSSGDEYEILPHQLFTVNGMIAASSNTASLFIQGSGSILSSSSSSANSFYAYIGPQSYRYSAGNSRMSLIGPNNNGHVQTAYLSSTTSYRCVYLFEEDRFLWAPPHSSSSSSMTVDAMSIDGLLN